MVQEGVLDIYTDGSCYPKPRGGGIGFIYVYAPPGSEEDVVEEFCPPGYKQATNNQMELEACILALEHAMDCNLLAQFNRVVIRTDSIYVVDNFERAKFEWPKTRWLRRSGAPVLNADLWKSLISCLKKTHARVELAWVRGHSKSSFNKGADKLAQQSANNPVSVPLAVVQARRKLSTASTEPGSVKMRGQRIAIRIVVARYLKVQKLFRYKYEVISISSRFYGKLDDICSKEVLRAGHSYLITLNRNDGNPMILRVIREIISQ